MIIIQVYQTYNHYRTIDKHVKTCWTRRPDVLAKTTGRVGQDDRMCWSRRPDVLVKTCTNLAKRNLSTADRLGKKDRTAEWNIKASSV